MENAQKNPQAMQEALLETSISRRNRQCFGSGSSTHMAGWNRLRPA